jgi:hypothetical protein
MVHANQTTARMLGNMPGIIMIRRKQMLALVASIDNVESIGNWPCSLTMAKKSGI